MTTHKLIEHFFANSGRIAGAFRLEIEAASASHEVPCGRLRVSMRDIENGSRESVIVSPGELALLIKLAAP